MPRVIGQVEKHDNSSHIHCMIKDIQLVFLSQRTSSFNKEICHFKLHCKSKKLDELLTNIYNKNDKVILPII